MTLNALQDAINLITLAEGVLQSHASWERKFEAIFSLGIGNAVEKAGSQLNWCDPDGSYQDDVCAFMDAAIAWRDDAQKLYGSKTTREEQLTDALREFIKDVESIGTEYIFEDLDWYDLLVTYKKAKALVDGEIVELPESSNA